MTRSKGSSFIRAVTPKHTTLEGLGRGKIAQSKDTPICTDCCSEILPCSCWSPGYPGAQKKAGPHVQQRCLPCSTFTPLAGCLPLGGTRTSLGLESGRLSSCSWEQGGMGTRYTAQQPSPERQILNLVTQLNGSMAGLRPLSSPSVPAAELWPRGPHYVHPLPSLSSL